MEYGRNAKSWPPGGPTRPTSPISRGFCARHGLAPLPAAATTLGLYLTTLAEAGRSVSTIRKGIAESSLYSVSDEVD